MDYLIALFQGFLQALPSGQQPQLGVWTYIVLAALVAVEGPVATLLGATAASAGLMQPGWVLVAAVVGNLTADTLWYRLGYLGKANWPLYFGAHLGIKDDLLRQLECEMQEHAARILFIGKLTLSMMIPALITAGLVKAPWKRWFPALFIGEMIWTGSLVLIGFYVTEAVKRVELGIKYLALGGALVFVVFLFVFLRSVVKKQYRGEIDPEKKD